MDKNKESEREILFYFLINLKIKSYVSRIKQMESKARTRVFIELSKLKWSKLLAMLNAEDGLKHN